MTDSEVVIESRARPAYDKFMEHRSSDCACGESGSGALKSSIKSDGDRTYWDNCPEGKVLWKAVRSEAAIRLTSFWEAMTLYPGMTPERWEASELSTCVGLHLYCDGYMDVKRVAEHWSAICCRSCHLRVVVPLTIKTIGQLRDWSERAVWKGDGKASLYEEYEDSITGEFLYRPRRSL
jgi:hypothetical protein